MYTVIVQLDVHDHCLDEFIVGIHANARASLADEPGCVRFDVLQDVESPTRFYFYEIYRDREAFEVDHRNAAHYAKWKDVVAQCVVPGTQFNRYGSYPFLDELPESRAVRETA